jgi:parallel beta-helix repeat protein
MKRKCLAVGIILLFIGTTIIPSSGQKIDKLSLPMSRGNTLYVGGSGLGNYSRIQDAVNDASDGDTVFVYNDSSPYYENNILINTSINLIGEDRNTTIIDGLGGGNDTNILRISADGVKVTGFSIRNYNKGYLDKGICIEGTVRGHGNPDTVSNVNISGNIFTNMSIAIYETKTFGTIISQNIFMSSGFSNGLVDAMEGCYDSFLRVGIESLYAKNSTIVGNMILNAEEVGIHFEHSHGLIEGNYISFGGQPSNQRGIDQFSSFDRIIGNTITKEGNGIQGTSFFSIISQNNISFCCGYGIVFVRPSRFNVITKNNISQCQHYGLGLYFSHYTVVKENNFIKNNISAYFMNSLMARWVHNYWDDWIGKGPKRINGLLVSPWVDWYNIVGMPYDNFDWHPAKEPYNIPGVRQWD